MQGGPTCILPAVSLEGFVENASLPPKHDAHCAPEHIGVDLDHAVVARSKRAQIDERAWLGKVCRRHEESLFVRDQPRGDGDRETELRPAVQDLLREET